MALSPTLPPMCDNTESSVIITGGTQGLGLAVARALIASGCTKITLAGRSADKGAKACAALLELGIEAYYVQADMSSPDDCADLFNAAVTRFGFVNGLVNSAAITDRGSLTDTTLEMWQMHMDLNLRGPFLMMQALARHLIETEKTGSMVNILSTSAYVGQSFLTPYATSKGGLLTLTKNAANAMRKNRIRVNAVAPGWMETEGEADIQRRFHGGGEDWAEKAAASTPMGQLVDPDELSPLIAYLLSPSSGLITGAIINYDQQIIGAVPE